MGEGEQRSSRRKEAKEVGESARWTAKGEEGKQGKTRQATTQKRVRIHHSETDTVRGVRGDSAEGVAAAGWVGDLCAPGAWVACSKQEQTLCPTPLQLLLLF